ncbi:MAG: type VI secretion system ATPase TssH [Phycisphaerales bacterium JB037]
MAEIDRKKLFGKLNSLCYKSVEAATIACKTAGNPHVEVVHFVNQVLQLQDSDLARLVRHFEINPSRLASDITAALERLPRNANALDFSESFEHGVERSWTYATLLFGEPSVRSGHFIYAMLKERDLRPALMHVSKEFEKIKLDEFSSSYEKILGQSVEASLAAKDGGAVGGGATPGEASGAMSPAQMGKEEALKKFCVDMTEAARTGEIDPIVGRDEETRQLVDILMRRRQNNPILTGEAGVGKTAVVEGFAHKIVSGDVPPPLENVRLLALDVGLLQAGASMKGEFENRLRQVIEEVQGSPTPIIMFIDEAHTLMGAGGAAGTGDAANLLKPALARGKLRTIAATTWAEYKKHIEKDPALTRRFQVVKVDEPTEDRCILMMRKISGMLEKHHQVQLLDEAIEAAVKLSHRYIPARQLPDKAVSLLDTASARVAIGQHAVPAAVDDSRKRIDALESELDILRGEREVGVNHDERITRVEGWLADERLKLAGLEEAWQKEKSLVDQILAIRAKLRGPRGIGPVDQTGTRDEASANLAAEQEQARSAEDNGQPAQPTDEERAKLLEELNALQDELADLQGESPLILPSVDSQAVGAVVSDWTGIPVGRMVKNEIEAVLKLGQALGQRVIGQQHGLDAIAKRIQTSRASLENPNKPIGVFMLAGPSGVGKTETALALAEALYGGEQNVITINMSEFQEAHTVSTLKGAPPGYVGYGEGGILTEAVRRKPYSIVLLDEVEKAHSDVHEIFFQVFDKGQMEDGEGRLIDFKNTIILLTTNVGSDLIMNMCKDPDLMPGVEVLQKALREPMLKVFPAALLGRISVIPYFPLSDEMIRAIANLQLGRIRKRIEANHGVSFEIDDSVLDLIASRCTELESGGRMIDAILTQTLLPDLSTEFLTRMMNGDGLARVSVRAENDAFVYDFA